jgi:hypothetical protein
MVLANEEKGDSATTQKRHILAKRSTLTGFFNPF